MSKDRLLTVLIIGLLATSLGSSIAAVHFYQLGLERPPQASNLDEEIGGFGLDLFHDNSTAFNIDSLITQVLELNSTHPQS